MTVTTPAHAAGTVNVDIYDDFDSATRTFTYWEITVDAITPNYGPITGGTTIIITGEHFDNTTKVKIDGTDVTPTSISSDGTTITIVTPPHIAGSVDIIVYDANTVLNNEDAFTYYDSISLTILDISPNSGSENGGTKVTLTGIVFGTTTGTVELGTSNSGYANCAVISWSDTEIVCTTSAHTAGAVDVKVTIGQSDATLSGAYTYTIDPFLSVSFHNDTLSSCKPQPNPEINLHATGSTHTNGVITTSACVLSVTTNNNGYKLSISTNNNDNSLKSTSTADKITAIQNGLNNPATLPAGKWGFALPKSNILASDNQTLLHNTNGLISSNFNNTYTTVNQESLSTSPARLYKFAAVPPVTNPILIKQTATSTLTNPADPNSGSDNTTTFFGVAVDRNVPENTYTTTVVYTISSND
jgi:hypothetical protein